MTAAVLVAFLVACAAVSLALPTERDNWRLRRWLDSRGDLVKCYEPDCENEAGGRWSPYWCPECDHQRVERISANLKRLVDRQ